MDREYAIVVDAPEPHAEYTTTCSSMKAQRSLYGFVLTVPVSMKFATNLPRTLEISF